MVIDKNFDNNDSAHLGIVVTKPWKRWHFWTRVVSGLICGGTGWFQSLKLLKSFLDARTINKNIVSSLEINFQSRGITDPKQAGVRQC